MRICAYLLSAALWFVSAPAESQAINGDVSTLKGQIDARTTYGLTVELYDMSRHETLTTSEFNGNGIFELRGAVAGEYVLTVRNEQGNVLYEGNITVGRPGMPPPIIHLPEIPPGHGASRPLAGAISVRQLQHPPTRRAFAAALQAQRLSEAGDYPKAAAALEKAIALSPDYADAHMNLGAVYFRQGRYQDSIAETQRSITLDGPTALKLCNLAFAQLRLANDAGALASARAALQLQPGDARAQYVVGLVLFFNSGPMDEVRNRLEFAGRTLPEARDALEKIAAGKLVPR